MWEDPIVTEVRRVRLELEAESGNSFANIYVQALKVQNEVSDRLVTDPPRLRQEHETSVEFEEA
ncbi:MAG: hypothetical protein KGZ35_00765 [Truepera sp.]|nr:hypothetical protein [Truepera sp.]